MTITASEKVTMKGFSFIELLASVAIMGLLASVALPLAETTVRRQKENELRTALRDIRQGIDAYKAASINGKIAKRAEESGYPKTLEELVSGVEDASQPGSKLYFLRRIPRDPFSQDASVSSVDTWRVRSFQSPPDNPRPGDDVFDISSKSTQHGLNGIPYSEW